MAGGTTCDGDSVRLRHGEGRVRPGADGCGRNGGAEHARLLGELCENRGSERRVTTALAGVHPGQRRVDELHAGWAGGTTRCVEAAAGPGGEAGDQAGGRAEGLLKRN